MSVGLLTVFQLSRSQVQNNLRFASEAVSSCALSEEVF